MSNNGVDCGGVEVKRVFIGAGCNRIVNNVSWGASDLVAFGAQNAVAIFCPKVSSFSGFTPHFCSHFFPSLFFPLELSPFFLINFSLIVCLNFGLKAAQILTTLPGHKAVVNCTQWLPSAKFAFKGTPSFFFLFNIKLLL